MLTVVDRPSGLVPPDAVRSPGRLPAEARVRGTVPAGAVLTDRHLAEGMAGLLDPGEAAVPVARDGRPAPAAGRRVDVVATSAGGTGTRVATGARVLALDAEWVWLGVPDGALEAVAAGAGAGQLVLAVRPG